MTTDEGDAITPEQITGICNAIIPYLEHDCDIIAVEKLAEVAIFAMTHPCTRNKAREILEAE